MITYSLKINDIKYVNSFRHILSTDGIYYEKNTYKLPIPIQMELHRTNTKDTISFTQPITKITIRKSLLSDDLHSLELALTNDTQILFSTDNPYNHSLKLFIDEKTVKEHNIRIPEKFIEK